MICDCCRRDVDYVRASFWHGDARLCRECLAQWYSPDYDQFGSANPMSVGNYVRLRHGLPLLATAIAILTLAGTTTAHASRHYLDDVEAARIGPVRALVQDGNGCWSYRHASRAELPNSMLQPTMMTGEAQPGSLAQTEPLVTMDRLLLFVSVVLATTVSAVATWPPQGGRPGRGPIRDRTC
jgi:hypothetical protein